MSGGLPTMPRNKLSRRQLLSMTAGAALAACAPREPVPQPPAKKLLAITMDDFNLNFDHRLNRADRNTAILSALAAHNHKAAGFVTGEFADTEFGRKVVQSWNDAGHVIGNHTYRHMNSTQTDADAVKADILKNDAFLAQFSRYNKDFRFPYLAEGGTPEKVADYRAFLDVNGLKNAPVTIDTIDWFVASRLEKRLRDDPKADVSGYRDYYVNSAVELAAQKHDLALRLGYRDLPHTVLVHHNILNGLFLKDVMDAWAAQGWTFIDADVALADPFYDLRPDTPNSGRSMLSVLAQEAGIPHKFPDAYRGFGKDTMEGLGL